MTILVFIPNGIGDLLMAVPLFRRLVEAYGVSNVVAVVAGHAHRDILTAIFSEKFTCWCRYNGRPWGQLQLLFKIARYRFDIGFAPLISNKLINKLFFLATFTRIVFPSSALKRSILWLRKGSGCLGDYPGHQVNYVINFAGSNGANIDMSTALSDEVKVCPLGPSKRVENGQIFLAVGLSCGKAERHKIPKPGFFAQAVNALSEHAAVRVFIFGVATDKPLIFEFESHIRDDIEVIKEIDKPIFEVISALSRCDVGLVGTTGQGHMMAAAGLPLLVTSGVTEACESGPYVSRAYVLKHEFPCGPCYQERYRFGCGRIECMNTLEPDKAALEIVKLARDESRGVDWMHNGRKAYPLPPEKIVEIVKKMLN